MNFGGRTPEAEARRIVAGALGAGLLDFDTANSYGDGESERILGRALHALGVTDARIATKVGLQRIAGKPEGLAPERVISSALKSRERLQCEAIHLFYLHAPDRTVPVEETLGAIKTLLKDGIIRSFGVSNYSAWQILELLHACRALDMPPPADSQVLYNAVVRQIEIEYLAFAARYEIRTTVYNPLAGGLLTGRHEAVVGNHQLNHQLNHQPNHQPPAWLKGSRLDTNRIYRARYGSPRILELSNGLSAIAAEEGLDPVTLAYRWLLGRPGVDRILLGPATASHLDAALAARSELLNAPARAKVAALQLAWDGTDAVYAR